MDQNILASIFSEGRKEAKKIADFLEAKRREKSLILDKDELRIKMQVLTNTIVQRLKQNGAIGGFYFAISYVSRIFNERIAFTDNLGNDRGKLCSWADLNNFYARCLKGPGISNILLRDSLHIAPWYEVAYSESAISDANNRALVIHKKSLDEIREAIDKQKGSFFPNRQAGKGFGIARAINSVFGKIVERYPIENDGSNKITPSESEGIKKWLELDKAQKFGINDIRSVKRFLQWFYLVISSKVNINRAIFLVARTEGNPSGALYVIAYDESTINGNIGELLWFLRAACSDIFLPIISKEQIISTENPAAIERAKDQPSAMWIFDMPSCETTFKFKEEKLIPYAQSGVNILLKGESGTGKSTVAKFIHEEFLRSKEKRLNANFVHINCADIIKPKKYDEGMYGVHNESEGFCSLANGGTLFLDEIWYLCGQLPIQAKLLLVLQEKTFYPCGSRKKIESDFRLITAAWQSLDGMQSDLKFRIAGREIEVPPLRDRFRESVGANGPNAADEAHRIILVTIYRFGKKLKWNIVCFDEEFIDNVIKHRWEGNIRELEIITQNAITEAKREGGEILKKIHLLRAGFVLNDT